MQVTFLRRLLPYLPEFGGIAFSRRLLAFIPHAGVQKLSTIIKTMHDRSVEIFTAKKEALARGDDAVTRQVGEGKDIMSILRQYFLLALRCREALWLILLDTSIVCART